MLDLLRVLLKNNSGQFYGERFSSTSEEPSRPVQLGTSLHINYVKNSAYLIEVCPTVQNEKTLMETTMRSMIPLHKEHRFHKNRCILVNDFLQHGGFHYSTYFCAFEESFSFLGVVTRKCLRAISLECTISERDSPTLQVFCRNSAPESSFAKSPLLGAEVKKEKLCLYDPHVAV